MFQFATPDVLVAAKQIVAALDRLADAVDRNTNNIIILGVKMQEALDKLAAQVAATTDVQKSAVVLIEGIVAELKQHAGEADKVNALADALAASTAPLAEAVTANTPANP